MAEPQSQQPAPVQEWRGEWQKLQQTSVYQDANDMERMAMRVGIFQDYVAPKLRNVDLERGFELFNAQTAPKGDASSGAVSDAWKLFKAGVQGGAADIAQGVTLGHKNAVADTMREWQQGNMEALSPSMLQDVENFGFERDESSPFGLDFTEGSTWQGFLGSTIQGVGSMVPSMVPGGIAGKALGIGGKAMAGTNKVVKAATASRKYKTANEALALGTKIEKRAMTVGQSAAMGGMIMGGTSNQAYEDVMGQSETELMKSPQYRQYVKDAGNAIGNDDPELAHAEARRRMAEEASLTNRLESFAVGAVSGLTQGAQIKMFKGIGGPKTRIGGMAKSGALEAVQETWESGGQQYLTNKSVADVGLERDLWDKVPETAATGALLGFSVGSPLGGIAKPRQALTPEQEQSQRKELEGNLKAYTLESDKIEADLSDPGLDDELTQQYETKLEELYRKRYNVERMLDGLPPVPQTHDPVNADPNREHVPSDIDETIKEDRKAKSDEEQSLKREMKNGGDADTAGRYEKSIGKKAHKLSIEQAMADNRGYSQYFNTQEEFVDWLIRSRKGGYTEFSANVELGQRIREYKQSKAEQKKQKQDLINQAFGMQASLLEANQAAALSEAQQLHQQRESVASQHSNSQQ